MRICEVKTNKEFNTVTETERYFMFNKEKYLKLIFTYLQLS